jgi:hypothetical protein
MIIQQIYEQDVCLTAVTLIRETKKAVPATNRIITFVILTQLFHKTSTKETEKGPGNNKGASKAERKPTEGLIQAA